MNLSENFLQVFEKINLPQEIKISFENTEIISIILNRTTKKMDINLRSLTLLEDEQKELLKNTLEKEFPYLSSVQINAKKLEVPRNESPPPSKKPNNFNGSFKSKSFKTKIKISEKLTPNFNLKNPLKENEEIIVQGEIFDLNFIEKNNIIAASLYDGETSVSFKIFADKHNVKQILETVKLKETVAVKGKVFFDNYSKELQINTTEIAKGFGMKRMDDAPRKRVELHLHTQMSQMDGIGSATEYINLAKEWGHTAIAITDHGVVQAFPEASHAKDIKIIYGMEAYLIDDESFIVKFPGEQDLDGDFVVFDLETTGLERGRNKIIEIGAVKIKDGQITDTFHTLIDPGYGLSDVIKKLTKITDDMLENQPKIEEKLPEFLEFCGDSVLVAHNVGFDVGFLSIEAGNINRSLYNTTLDTVELSRLLIPASDIKNHKLNTVATHLGINLENHHRAVDDARATGEIFLKLRTLLKEKGIGSLKEINAYALANMDINLVKDNVHATILVQNTQGLRNLYEMVSLSHLDYFFKGGKPKHGRPRIPMSLLKSKRDGLLIGSGCIKGRVYQNLLSGRPIFEVERLASFYDYLEIQPHTNYSHYSDTQFERLPDINQKIIDIGRSLNKPVAATGNVHFLEPGDSIYRQVILHGEGNFAPKTSLYFRTTEEMLAEFKYLDELTATEVVIENTNKIADSLENIIPIPKGTFPPHIEGSDEQLKEIVYANMERIYGDNAFVRERVDRELNSIISNGFAIMYMASYTLIKRSLESRYTVGSRGSVGSSVVATLAEITEVNPLPAHYICTCKHCEFESDEIKELQKNFPGASGCDLPDKNCPHCRIPMQKEGHDIPFETFLGFEGDKEPDIDLNFSGEYQALAHEHTKELFGDDKVYKAGTISTLADKTAYAYTRKYMEENDLTLTQSELNRIKLGATGVKKTTGQHPGGLMIVPSDRSIYDFTPIQRPANDSKSSVITTHFDYRSISGRLLKLDLLGHDVPTILRLLWDTTDLDPTTVPLSDPAVLSLFRSPKALGLTKKDVDTGSLGIPEFGTNFVRGMLQDTEPASFGELVRISGLSHGTDVWLNNAKDLIKNRICTLKDVIATRDDIMIYLISMGMDKKAAFNITESVRRGKGLTSHEEETMFYHDIPSWYIESCKKIKYMFPKGHAVAYVMMAVRIAYYKVYHPIAFYGAILSVKTEDFDYEKMAMGLERVQAELAEQEAKTDATVKDRSVTATLELVKEMYLRGLKFLPLDIYTAKESKFTITKDGLMPPLSSIRGLGENAAANIVKERDNGEFNSLQNFKERTKANKNTIQLLVGLKILDGLPETRQLTLF